MGIFLVPVEPVLFPIMAFPPALMLIRTASVLLPVELMTALCKAPFQTRIPF